MEIVPDKDDYSVVVKGSEAELKVFFGNFIDSRPINLEDGITNVLFSGDDYSFMLGWYQKNPGECRIMLDSIIDYNYQKMLEIVNSLANSSF